MGLPSAMALWLFIITHIVFLDQSVGTSREVPSGLRGGGTVFFEAGQEDLFGDSTEPEEEEDAGNAGAGFDDME